MYKKTSFLKDLIITRLCNQVNSRNIRHEIVLNYPVNGWSNIDVANKFTFKKYDEFKGMTSIKKEEISVEVILKTINELRNGEYKIKIWYPELLSYKTLTYDEYIKQKDNVLWMGCMY